jgi:hypothetical protein
MIIPPGATSVSVDVFFADDAGAAVTAKVASDFPVCKWSSGTNTADTTITLSDLAAITTAHPNDNTAGGIKEREGGWYRLDLPNNMFTSAGRKTLTFAETTNKRIIAPFIDCQYTQADARQLLGTAWLTPAVAGTPDVNAKQLGGTAQTGRDIGASVLLSNGTGTGQLKLASGYVAMTWADIAAPTTSNNLSGTTIATVSGNVSGNVGGNVTGSVGSISGITFPTNFSSLVIDSTGRVNAFLIGILTSVFTEGTVGRIAAAFKQFFNIASPAATMDHGILVDTATTVTNHSLRPRSQPASGPTRRPATSRPRSVSVSRS